MPDPDQAVAPGDRPAVTVAAAGNSFVNFDRIGPLVLDRLSGRLPRGAETVNVGTAGLDLLDHLRGQGLLLVVDACLSGADPGTVVVTEPDFSGAPLHAVTMHHVGPREVLTVASFLCPDRLPGRCKFVLVETGDLPDEDMSDAADRAAGIVEREVVDWFQSNPTREALKEEHPAGR